MRNLFLFVVFQAMSTTLISQTFQVSGLIEDAEGGPLSFANILLFRSSDSVQTKGTSADELGKFTFAGLSGGAYFLQAQYFGYESAQIGFELESDMELGEVVLNLEGNLLDEVVLNGSRPTIERQSDRVIFRVENTLLSQQSTWDILRKAPGVILIQEKLEIRGQEATIYLNDRKVQLSSEETLDLLKGLSGDMISAVEVIPNPPARYDAQGGPVLNIKTRQNIVPGYKGSIRSQFEQAIFPKYSFGTSQFYKGGKFGVLANYGINPRKEFKRTEYYANFFDANSDVYARWKTKMERTNRSLDQQATIMLDYEPAKGDRLNLTSNVSTSPNKTGDYSIETLMRNALGDLDSTLQTQSALEDDKINITADLNYEHQLKKEGAYVRSNLHHTQYNMERTQRGNSDYFSPQAAFLRSFGFSTDAKQEIDITTAQFDYYTPVEYGSFETGVKGSFINSKSRINYLDVNNTAPPFDIALSDRFHYKESVGAAYASLSKKWSLWSLKLGLRLEHTEVRAQSLTLDQINSQSYFQPFPNVNVGRQLGDKSSINLTYNRKLTRPNYQDLNPFRFFVNENDYDQGNPNLVPNYSQNFNLNLSLKNTFFIDVYYRDNGRYISPLSFQDNTNQVLLEIYQNVEKSHSYGVDFTLSTSIARFWDFYAYTSIFHEDETFLDPENQGGLLNNMVDGFYGYFSNDLTLSKDGTFTGEVSVLYLSGFLFGTYKMTETTTLNVGIRKSLGEGRAVLSLVGEDLLYRANARYISTYRTQDNGYAPLPETRLIRLGFTYNFGNFRLKSRSVNVRNAELQRIQEE